MCYLHLIHNLLNLASTLTRGLSLTFPLYTSHYLPIPSVPPQSAETNSILWDPSRACELPSREWAHKYCSMSWMDETMEREKDRARTILSSARFLYMTRASVWWGMNQRFSTCWPLLVRSCLGRFLSCLVNMFHRLKYSEIYLSWHKHKMKVCVALNNI